MLGLVLGVGEEDSPVKVCRMHHILDQQHRIDFAVWYSLCGSSNNAHWMPERSTKSCVQGRKSHGKFETALELQEGFLLSGANDRHLCVELKSYPTEVRPGSNTISRYQRQRTYITTRAS